MFVRKPVFVEAADLITVVSRDQEIFRVPRKQMEQAQTCKACLEDLAVAGTTVASQFEMPEVDAVSFRMVLNYFDWVSVSGPHPTGEAPLPEDLPNLMRLARAANYLAIDGLLTTACTAVESRVRGRKISELALSLGFPLNETEERTSCELGLRVVRRWNSKAPDSRRMTVRSSQQICPSSGRKDSALAWHSASESGRLGPGETASHADEKLRIAEVREAMFTIVNFSDDREVCAKLAELSGLESRFKDSLENLSRWGCLRLLKKHYRESPDEHDAALAVLLKNRDFATLDWLLLKTEARENMTTNFLAKQLTFAFLAGYWDVVDWLLLRGRKKGIVRLENVKSLLLAGARPENHGQMNWLLGRATFARSELVGVLFFNLLRNSSFNFARRVAASVKIVTSDVSENWVLTLAQEGKLDALKFLFEYFEDLSSRLAEFSRDFLHSVVATDDLEIAMWLVAKIPGGLGIQRARDLAFLPSTYSYRGMCPAMDDWVTGILCETSRQLRSAELT